MLAALLALSLAQTDGASPARAAALGAARWIEHSALETPAGLDWPADPADPKSVSDSLYAGAPGVILFFLEAHHATHDGHDLELARRGADRLAASLRAVPADAELGLYTGIAGAAFVLDAVADATHEEKYREAARLGLEILHERARPAGTGVEWNEATDIIAGSSGIGLYLLWAARTYHDESSRALAIRAGKRLIEVAVPEGKNRKWKMSESFARLMPNFSHGTAGVAYFLARLHEETKQQEFLDAALAGAHYLQSVAKADGDQCLVFHHEPEPDGKDLFYLGWCHGPAGTARLFQELSRIQPDGGWSSWVTRCANGIAKSGIPDQLTPGFWNNVSACCGSAGVGEFFLALHRRTSDPAYLAFARRMTTQILSKATTDEHGTRWIQAEHRVKPDLLVAQTGYMQGAAGIGLWLLHLSELDDGVKPLVTLPDSPW